MTIYVDLDRGVLLARQNPSCVIGGGCRALVPQIHVFNARGETWISYVATNAAAETKAKLSGPQVSGHIGISVKSEHVGLDGTVGEFPSFEAYHDNSNGIYDGHPLAQHKESGRTPGWIPGIGDLPLGWWSQTNIGEGNRPPDQPPIFINVP